MINGSCNRRLSIGKRGVRNGYGVQPLSKRLPNPEVDTAGKSISRTYLLSVKLSGSIYAPVWCGVLIATPFSLLCVVRLAGGVRRFDAGYIKDHFGTS